MTPYPEPEPGPQQRFNVAHCRTRARVEMTIGLLKARFQCLRHLRVTPERACDIIAACVVLHNIAIIRGEQHPALQIQDLEEDPIHPADFRDGRLVRDIICRNFFSDSTTTHKRNKMNKYKLQQFIWSSLFPSNTKATVRFSYSSNNSFNSPVTIHSLLASLSGCRFPDLPFGSDGPSI